MCVVPVRLQLKCDLLNKSAWRSYSWIRIVTRYTHDKRKKWNDSRAMCVRQRSEVTQVKSRKLTMMSDNVLCDSGAEWVFCVCGFNGRGLMERSWVLDLVFLSASHASRLWPIVAPVFEWVYLSWGINAAPPAGYSHTWQPQAVGGSLTSCFIL